MIISAQLTPSFQIDSNRALRFIVNAIKCTVAGVILVPVIRTVGLETIVAALARISQIVMAVLLNVKWSALIVLPEISVGKLDPFMMLAIEGVLVMTALMGVAILSARFVEAEM